MFETKLLRNISKDEMVNFSLGVRMVPEQKNTPVHMHDFIELVLVLSGSGFHEIGDTLTQIRAGDVFVIPRKSIHGYQNCSDDLSLINILFIPESIPLPLLDITLLPGYEALYLCKVSEQEQYPFFHLQENDFSFIRDLTLELYHENESRKPGYQFNMLGLFISLIGRLIRIYSCGHTSSKKVYINTAEVISYLNRNFKKNIEIAKLCTIAGMSKATLMRNFYRATGTTPLQYQMRLRIAEAAMLLRDTEKTLTDIAFEVGFCDSNYFGRQFKRFAASAPGEYRKKYQNGIAGD